MYLSVDGIARAHDHGVPQSLDLDALAYVTGGYDYVLDQCKLYDGNLVSPTGMGPSYAASVSLQYNALGCPAKLRANGITPRAP